MWSPQKKENQDETLGKFPNVCAEQPAPGSAFCPVHAKAVEDLNYPSALREFLITCGANPGNYTKEQKEKVRSILEDLSNESTTGVVTQSGADMQGTSFLLENKDLRPDSGQMEAGKSCNKDTGEIFRLHNWSRGIQVIVGAGGHNFQSGNIHLLILGWAGQTVRNILRGLQYIDALAGTAFALSSPENLLKNVIINLFGARQLILAFLQHKMHYLLIFWLPHLYTCEIQKQ